MKGVVLLGLAVVALIGGGAEYALSRIAPPERVEDWRGGVLWFAALVNLAACWLAFVPFAVAKARFANHLFEAALAAMPIRLLLVGGVSLWGLWEGPWPRGPLVTWMVAFYLALLAAETGWTVRQIQEADRQNRTGVPAARDENGKR